MRAVFFEKKFSSSPVNISWKENEVKTEMQKIPGTNSVKVETVSESIQVTAKEDKTIVKEADLGKQVSDSAKEPKAMPLTKKQLTELEAKSKKEQAEIAKRQAEEDARVAKEKAASEKKERDEAIKLAEEKARVERVQREAEEMAEKAEQEKKTHSWPITLSHYC